MFKIDMGYKEYQNVNIIIKLHSVCYVPMDGNSIVDKSNNAQSCCH